MKEIRKNRLLGAALGAALIASTYVAAQTCWRNDYAIPCRNVTTSTPSDTAIVSDVTCTLDSNSYNDNLVGYNAAQITPGSGLGHFQRMSDTVCGVAYDCPPPAHPIEYVGYAMNTVYDVYYGTC